MVASSSVRQQKEKYLHFSPSEERIGKEQFSQDTPLFSWQQELYCWDCLQSHVTNTPASPVCSACCKYYFSQKSQCSLALFYFILWTPGSICSIPLQKGRQFLFSGSSEAKQWSCQSQDLSRACRAEVFLQLHLYSSVTSSIVMDVIMYIRKNDHLNKLYW